MTKFVGLQEEILPTICGLPQSLIRVAHQRADQVFQMGKAMLFQVADVVHAMRRIPIF
jgi:hypothetical protein